MISNISPETKTTISQASDLTLVDYFVLVGHDNNALLQAVILMFLKSKDRILFYEDSIWLICSNTVIFLRCNARFIQASHDVLQTYPASCVFSKSEYVHFKCLYSLQIEPVGLNNSDAAEALYIPPLERSYVASILHHFPKRRSAYPFPSEIISVQALIFSNNKHLQEKRFSLIRLNLDK